MTEPETTYTCGSCGSRKFTIHSSGEPLMICCDGCTRMASALRGETLADLWKRITRPEPTERKT